MKSCTKDGRLRAIAAAATAAVLVALAASPVVAQVPAMPKSPVTLNITDPAGDLQLTRAAIDEYQRKHPELLAKINIVAATAPEIPAKLKAMQGAGRMDIDLILTGTDFLAAGVEQGLLMQLLPTYAAKFPNLMANYLPAAAKMQGGRRLRYRGRVRRGASIECNPDKVKQPPTAAGLLAWCKASGPADPLARKLRPGRPSSWGCLHLGDQRRTRSKAGTRPGLPGRELNSCIEYATGTGNDEGFGGCQDMNVR
jgi:putative spermidine/putrescine transport system substrate-binding protein